MKMLLAIMNSLIYEFQARSLLVSNHVSAGVVKQIHVPEPIIDDEIIRLVDSQLAGNNVERELEVRTALLYNLSSDEYESVVSSFGITDEEKQQLVENYKDNNEKMSWRSSTKIRYICAVHSPIPLNFVSSLITSLSGKLSKVSNTR